MKTENFKLYTYDLHGNDTDGYTINDYYYQDTIQLQDIENLSDEDIIAEIDFLEPDKIEITLDSDNDHLYFANRKTGSPICELRIDK